MERRQLILTKQPVSKFGKRHVLVIWLFFGFVNVYILRNAINTAIVSMIFDNMTNGSNKTNNSDDTCPLPPFVINGSSSVTIMKGEFEWDHQTRGVILSAFFYGYICTQLIGGYLPQYTGGRLLFGVAVAGTGILTLFTPIAARTSSSLLIVVRVLEGLFLGITFPVNHALCSSWIPQQERSLLVALPIAGTFIGTIIAAALTGVFCEYGFDGGWPTAFYIFGAMSLVWCVGWFASVHDSPSKHPTISDEERSFIEMNCQSKTGDTVSASFGQIPWKSILLSPPVWAAVIAQTAYTWNYYTLLTQLSSYLKDVLHISDTMNGIVTSLPYVFMFVVSLLAAYSADLLRAKGVATKWVRKGSFTLGMVGSSVVLVIIGYAGCNATLVIILLCIAIAIVGFGYSACMVNHVDIAPQYAALIMGLANTFGTLSGILSPMLTGVIVNDESSVISSWQTVFYISAGISTAGAIFFALLGDGEVQKWAAVVVLPENASPTTDDNNEASAGIISKR